MIDATSGTSFECDARMKIRRDQLHLMALVCKKIRHGKRLIVLLAANDGDPVAQRDFPVEHIAGVHHVRAFECLDSGLQRLRARRHDHDVRRLPLYEFHGHFAFEMNLHLELFELRDVVASDLSDLVAEGRARSEQRLATQLRCPFEEPYAMSAQCGDARGFEPRRSATHYHHAAGSLGGRDHHLRFPAHFRIHRAGNRQPVLKASDALVACDAAADVLEPSFTRLDGQLRVGHQGAIHRHQVSDISREHVFGDQRIVDALRADHREIRHLANRLRQIHQTTRPVIRWRNVSGGAGTRADMK